MAARVTTMAKSTGELLLKLRELMRANNIAAYLVPMEDAHQSEYIAAADKRLHFLSGFSGSRGLGVVTTVHAAMWTDGRYFVQAAKEMDDNWQLMKENLPDTPELHQWLGTELTRGDAVGVDPKLISAHSFAAYSQQLQLEKGLQLKPVASNLVDELWSDKPARPANAVHVLPVEYSGVGVDTKLEQLRDQMHKKNVGVLVLSALDDIAWTFNLRGSDIDYNPVFFAYAVITGQDAHIFVASSQANSTGVREHLTGVQIHDYNSIIDELKKIIDGSDADTKIWLPAPTASYALSVLVDKNRQLTDTSPATHLKSVKNATELEGFRYSHLKDAVAHCEFLHWLEQQMATQQPVTEISASDYIGARRALQKDFVSLSFPTISAVGANAAQPHYRTSSDNDTSLRADRVYLCDSGAQYRDGTTDVTRTMVFDNHKQNYLLRKAYTLVLKGHIALARQRFPEGTVGMRVDTLSRAPLWELGLDFAHGTGHGVGHFLNVHEGPAGIGYRAGSMAQHGIKENMVLTIEPGYYDTKAELGIRIENVYLVRCASTEYGLRSPDKKFLQFEPVTLVPIQTTLIEADLLSSEEVNWLNYYHAVVNEKVGEELSKQGKPELRSWLAEQCRPIDVSLAAHFMQTKHAY